jgi:hypothetical protein
LTIKFGTARDWGALVGYPILQFGRIARYRPLRPGHALQAIGDMGHIDASD